MNRLVYREPNTEYFFNGEDLDSYGEEIVVPEWEINPALYQAVYDRMPENLSAEEKAMFVYFRLCYLLKYDEGYMYSNRIGPQERKKYDYDFCKERIEGIKPTSLVTCFDLSRIFCKFLLDFKSDEIVPFYKLHGINRGHASMGFYTDSCCVELDPILITENKQTNDLLNLKMGVVPDGVHIIYDREDMFGKSLEELYPIATTGVAPNSLLYRLLELRNISGKLVPDDREVTLGDKLESVSKVIKSKNIVGNEAVQLLINYNKMGFFDNRLKIALCAEEREPGYFGGRKFIRKALIREDNGDNSVSTRGNYKYYLFDTQSLDVSEVNPDEISKDFVARLYTFESERQEFKMPEIADGGR